MNKPQEESQTSKIEKYLLAGNKLTALSAFKKFGTLRISARIKEIRERHNVKTETVKKKKKTVWQYSIPICFAIFLLSSCDGADPSRNDKFSDPDLTWLGNPGADYYTRVFVDGHEYLSAYKGGIVHLESCGHKNHRKEYENKVN